MRTTPVLARSPLGLAQERRGILCATGNIGDDTEQEGYIHMYVNDAEPEYGILVDQRLLLVLGVCKVVTLVGAGG